MVHKRVKFIAYILVPLVASLWFVFDLPNSNEFLGTLFIVELMIGILLWIVERSVEYDGIMDIKDSEDLTSFVLNLDTDPEELGSKKQIVFKVNVI